MELTKRAEKQNIQYNTKEPLRAKGESTNVKGLVVGESDVCGFMNLHILMD